MGRFFFCLVYMMFGKGDGDLVYPLCSFLSILSTKRNAMFLFAILGLKVIDFKKCFNSVVLPSNKDLDCIVSS